MAGAKNRLTKLHQSRAAKRCLLTFYDIYNLDAFMDALYTRVPRLQALALSSGQRIRVTELRPHRQVRELQRTLLLEKCTTRLSCRQKEVSCYNDNVLLCMANDKVIVINSSKITSSNLSFQNTCLLPTPSIKPLFLTISFGNISIPSTKLYQPTERLEAIRLVLMLRQALFTTWSLLITCIF